MTNKAIECITEDKLFLKFVRSRQLKPHTIRNYATGLAKYLEVTGQKTVTEMIEQAEDDEDQGLRMRRRRIDNQLLEYYEYLKSNYTANGVRTNMNAVKTFYRAHNIQLPNLKMKLEETDETEKDIPTAEELRKALDYCNEKYKAIVLLMSSSGIPSAELRNLTVQDFLKAIDKTPKDPEDDAFDIHQFGKIDPNIIAIWDIKRVKTGKRYCALSSPESIEYIQRYLRNKPPQTIHDPLFPNRYGNKMGYKALSNYLIEVNRKCGFGNLSNGFTYLHPHSLRKFFSTTLVKNGLSETYTRWLLGHTLVSKTAASYIKPTIEGLKGEYLRMLPYLSIMENVETRVMTDKRLREMEEGRKQDQKRIDELEKIIKRRYQIEQIPPTK